jgi:hypothetical protein
LQYIATIPVGVTNLISCVNFIRTITVASTVFITITINKLVRVTASVDTDEYVFFLFLNLS